MAACLTWLTILNTALLSQNVTARIVDGNTGEAIPYANVLVSGSRYGTVTKSDGSFQIDKEEAESSGDSILISIIGYRGKAVSIRSLVDGDTIPLHAQAVQLDAAIVTPKSPGEYIRMAIREIPVNYASQAFNAVIYYKSSLKLNGRFIGSTEAIMKGYIMPS